MGLTYKERCSELSDLLGQTMKDVRYVSDIETVFFESVDGRAYKLYHEQDCCECVVLEELHGDLKDLVGSPILQAELVENCPEPYPDREYESHTWSFYKFATIKGSVTMRWLGESNGYYSESVDFRRIE